MNSENNKDMKFLHDYTLNDSLGDYNSLEKFHKKLMALRKKYEKEKKMEEKILDDIVEDLIRIRKKAREIQDLTGDVIDKIGKTRNKET